MRCVLEEEVRCVGGGSEVVWEEEMRCVWEEVRCGGRK